MPAIPGLLASLLAALLATAPAAALTCPKDRVRVKIELRASEPTIDRSMQRAELTAMSNVAGESMHTLGIYGATWTIRSQSQMKLLKEQGTRQPRGCAWLASVQITVAIEPRVIRIASELRPESCRYRSVLEHERKHQAVDDALLTRRIPWLRDHLANALAGMRSDKPVPVAELAELERRMNENATNTVAAAWQELADERDRLQREVDSPEEYARVGAACAE